MPPFDFHLSRRAALPSLIAAAAAALLLLGAPQASIAGAAAYDPDAQPTGWVTRPALTSQNLRSGTETIFRADYRAGPWTGAVVARSIAANGDVQPDGPWDDDTAEILDQSNWDLERRIITRTGAGASVPFRWINLDASQKTLLGGNTTGPKVLDFVRGDRSNETPLGAKYRARESVQGDIQHSTLLYWKHATGERRIYVGGNDGMLHAFDATSGEEVFAYVPSMLVSRLPRLTSIPYVHSLFVDGGLSAADVMVGGSLRTLLAGALGGGGMGLFMLDVSNPAPQTETAATALIKWEVTSATTGFANLGYSYAEPRMARLNNGVAAVVVGNGYGNAGNGRATLLLIDASTGALIREIDTGSGTTAVPNGLSTATLVDFDQDGKVDYAYAGDLYGNLWRFDLRGSSPAAFSAALVMTTSPARAITTTPVVVDHPNGGRLVIFGTGRTLTPADTSDTAVNTVYGVWDGAPVANTTWLDQTLAETSLGTQRLRTVTKLQPNWASGGNRGWRLALPAGERVVGPGQYINDDRYYFVSTNPTVPAAASGEATGSNWTMEINFLTGGSPRAAVLDINRDGKVDSSDNIAGSVVIGKYLGAGVSSQATLTDITGFSVTLFNRQSDLDYTPPVASSETGVSGGHFDVDFYYTAPSTKSGVSGSMSNIKHRHQYDDTFDVTGVNFLNASDPIFNLGTKFTSATSFKVMLMNQYLNPAVKVSIGGAAYVDVKTYGGQATQTDAAALLSSMPTYNMSNISSLIFNLPMDAFASKDWWGDGAGVRSGLIPTTTGCVNRVNSDGSTPRLGLYGERHDGAFTLQLISPSTPASALELNYPAGGPKYGWRVKAGLVTTYVLAEYTTFWHHPNGKCYGDAGWVQNAPQTAGGGTATRPAAGSADPRDGVFGITPAGVTVTSVTTTTNGDTTVTLIKYSDGKTQRTTVTANNNGTDTVTVLGRDGTTTTGTRMSSGSLSRAPEEILQSSRRINWRELIRQ